MILNKQKYLWYCVTLILNTLILKPVGKLSGDCALVLI